MILLIGGAGQGKLAYAMEKTGLGRENVAHDPVSARTKPIFNGLADWVRSHPGEGIGDLLKANPGVVILCDEVGCGVVPMEPFEREWRETVGRICCELAKNAEHVARVFCGIPMMLKGECEWK